MVSVGSPVFALKIYGQPINISLNILKEIIMENVKGFLIIKIEKLTEWNEKQTEREFVEWVFARVFVWRVFTHIDFSGRTIWLKAKHYKHQYAFISDITLGTFFEWKYLSRTCIDNFKQFCLAL